MIEDVGGHDQDLLVVLFFDFFEGQILRVGHSAQHEHDKVFFGRLRYGVRHRAHFQAQRFLGCGLLEAGEDVSRAGLSHQKEVVILVADSCRLARARALTLAVLVKRKRALQVGRVLQVEETLEVLGQERDVALVEVVEVGLMVSGTHSHLLRASAPR